MQKVHYIHQNPVRANLVENAEDYLYTSVRIWHRKRLEMSLFKLMLIKLNGGRRSFIFCGKFDKKTHLKRCIVENRNSVIIAKELNED